MTPDPAAAAAMPTPTEPIDPPPPARGADPPADGHRPRPIMLIVRAAVGGVLMGLANLVPGISGGTMLVAAGVYRRFIDAIAELSTLKFKRDSILVLGTVVAAAGCAIVLLAGPVKHLVLEHRWVMYALFIGLTLGGAPVVWKMIDRATGSVWLGAAAGFGAMALLAVMQANGQDAAGKAEAGWVLLFVAGVAGASAMILPGVSGGYLLLVLGVYVTVLDAIDAAMQAARARDFAALSDPVLTVVLPVGLGVLVGVVLVSNALKWVLHRFERPTLGVLLGLLIGAVVGLWPFQQTVTPELIAGLPPKDLPTEFFTPTTGQVFGAIGLIAVGFAATALIALLGKEKGRG